MAAQGGTAPRGRAGIQAVNHSALLCHSEKDRIQEAKATKGLQPAKGRDGTPKEICKCLCHKGGQREKWLLRQEGKAEHSEQQAESDILLSLPLAAENPGITLSPAPIVIGQGKHLKAERAGKLTLNQGTPAWRGQSSREIGADR